MDPSILVFFGTIAAILGIALVLGWLLSLDFRQLINWKLRRVGGKSINKLGEPDDPHFITRLDYSQTAYGPWPQWHCKCGMNDRYVVHSELGLKLGERKAKRAGIRHVKLGNKCTNKQLGNYMF